MFSPKENAGLRDGTLIRQIGHKSFDNISNVNDILIPAIDYLIDNNYVEKNTWWRETSCVGSHPSYSISSFSNSDSNNPFILELTTFHKSKAFVVYWLTIYAERPINACSIKRTQLLRILNNVAYEINNNLAIAFNNKKQSDYSRVEFWFTTVLIILVFGLVFGYLF